MFATDYFEADQEIRREINHVWHPEHWEMAAKLTGDPEILSLAGAIHCKLHQVRYYLENILQQDQKMMKPGEHSKQDWKISAFIMKCEIESLLLALHQTMDLMAGMIATVYGIKTNVSEISLKDFFPSLINSKPFFNELQRKDPILVEQISSFYFSVENKLMMKLLYPNGPHSLAFTGGSSSYKMEVQTGLDAQTMMRIEKAYRQVVCLLGQIMFNHLNYEPVLIQYFPGYQPAYLS